MIRSVTITNFEAHKSTHLEFDKGLNVLRGSSGAGKSSIKRAILWVLTNRPSAGQVVSWWAVNSKGKQTEETRVTITLDDGTTISRIKSDILNGYQINDERPLEAVGTSVPEEVSKLLNMSDVNSQIQLAAPFLISQSASYVAQYINDIVDMSEADRYQSAIESKRRKCNADMVANAEAIKNTTEELTHFGWLEEAEKRINRIEKIETDTSKLDADASAIRKSIADVEYHTQKLESCDVIPEAESLSLKILDLILCIKDSTKWKLSLSDSIQQIQKHQKALDDGAVVEKAEKCVRRITRILDEQKSLASDVAYIKDLIGRKTVAESNLSTVSEELDVEERAFKLIEFCPTCGSKLDGHKCEF